MVTPSSGVQYGDKFHLHNCFLIAVISSFLPFAVFFLNDGVDTGLDVLWRRIGASIDSSFIKKNPAVMHIGAEWLLRLSGRSLFRALLLCGPC